MNIWEDLREKFDPDADEDDWHDDWFGLSGRDFYKKVARYLGSEQMASIYLYDKGINGIHYNGGTDGECWVIFNCRDLKIVNEE